MNSKVAERLNKIESELKAANAWSDVAPADELLASETPFCADTLPFEQWLQFVFIARFRVMIDSGQPLPRNFSVAPAAEMLLKINEVQAAEVIQLLAEIDGLLQA